MSIYGKGVMAGGGKKPTPLSVSTNGTWSINGGYSPVNVSVPASAVTAGTITISNNGLTNVIEYQNANVSVPASAVTSGTKTIVANGVYDVTEFKNVRVVIGAEIAATSPIDGLSYVDGLPSDWNTMKEIAKIISEAAGSINANTTGPIYVNKGNTWAYKITPGNTINVTSQIGTYTYAVMGFNNFALTNRGNYGGTHNTAGLTFGAVDCVTTAKMNSNATTIGGWGECLMRTSTMPTLKNGMPSTLAQVKVPYVDSNNNESILLYSDDYLFLPAEKEVFGTRFISPEVEANALTQFAYYKNGGSTNKKIPGSAYYWWNRSAPYYAGSGNFCSVYNGGAWNTNADYPAGVAPCFCV